MQNSQDVWFVEAQGLIYESTLAELKEWVAEGAVLSTDRVQRGNLRWVRAELVPELMECFKPLRVPGGIVSHAGSLASSQSFEETSHQVQTEHNKPLYDENWEKHAEKICHYHSNLGAVFACDICMVYFCKTCTNAFTGGIKLCHLCGSLCRLADEPVSTKKTISGINKPYSKNEHQESKNSELKNLKTSKDSTIGKPFSRLFSLFKD